MVFSSSAAAEATATLSSSVSGPQTTEGFSVVLMNDIEGNNVFGTGNGGN